MDERELALAEVGRLVRDTRAGLMDRWLGCNSFTRRKGREGGESVMRHD
jgi:hypothetical protein